MSYFDDQFDAWMENNCQGNIEDYDGTEFDIEESDVSNEQ